MNWRVSHGTSGAYGSYGAYRVPVVSPLEVPGGTSYGHNETNTNNQQPSKETHMKKDLGILVMGILAMMYTACSETGSSSPSAPSYEYESTSSSSVRSLAYSSSVVPNEDYTPIVPIPKSSSSIVPHVTLEEVCNEAAIALMSEGTYSTMSSVCSEYQGFLSYIGLTGSEINVCMELEGCNQASPGTQPSGHRDSIYVSQCNKSFECTIGDCLSCMDKIRSQAAGMGVGRSSGTCNRIKQECFGVYY